MTLLQDLIRLKVKKKSRKYDSNYYEKTYLASLPQPMRYDNKMTAEDTKILTVMQKKILLLTSKSFPPKKVQINRRDQLT